MFSGIVEGNYKVSRVEHSEGLIGISVELPQELVSRLSVGASVAVDGVCLTVTRITEREVTFDVIRETIRVTTLRDISEGSLVNIECSLTGDKDISGHIVSGHVDDVVYIDSIERPDANNCTVIFRAQEEWMKYIFPKGFIALDGCSLTVGFVDRRACRFCVYLIPETLRRTTFAHKRVGDAVNLEVERQTQAIVDTMNIFLEKLEAKLLSGEAHPRVLEEMIPALTSKALL